MKMSPSAILGRRDERGGRRVIYLCDTLPIGGVIRCQYVPHHLVPECAEQGWTDEGPLPSPHGWYSNLMTREGAE